PAPAGLRGVARALRDGAEPDPAGAARRRAHPLRAARRAAAVRGAGLSGRAPLAGLLLVGVVDVVRADPGAGARERAPPGRFRSFFSHRRAPAPARVGVYHRLSADLRSRADRALKTSKSRNS